LKIAMLRVYDSPMTRKGTKSVTREGKKRKALLHHDLDRLIGVWSREEAESFDRALKNQRKLETGLSK
jgi:hypothetical protein